MPAMPLVLQTYTDDPWQPPQAHFNKFARLDHNLGQRLRMLSQRQSHDNRLASAIELGRIYGLQAQKYDMLLKRQLNQDKPETQDMW